MGRTIWGVLGVGAFGWDRVEPPQNRRVLITSRSHSNPLVNRCIENMSPTHIERQGGAGNKVTFIISTSFLPLLIGSQSYGRYC